ncbi:MAG: hypothetical protein HY983_04025 [Candidatus Magasanikbacteria bacterium]|nr:hypothetical protein [Candidatus Magasanikbacteria bacterium]
MRIALEKKIIAAIIALAGIVVFIIAGIIIPTIRYIRELDRETYELRVYLEKKYERSLSIRSTLKQAEAISAELAHIPDRLFREGDELNLITELEAIAAKNIISQKIVSSNFDNVTNRRITISLAIAGSYRDTLNYLTDLENERFFIAITRVTLTPTPGQNRVADAGVTMNLDISVYVSPR